MVDKKKNANVNNSNEKKAKMRQSHASPKVSDLIGERLRNFYDGVARQPVPDRFLDLLTQLEAASPPKKES